MLARMAGDHLYRPVTNTELVVNALGRWPERVAFRQDDRSYTYAETASRIASFAAVFRGRGLERGQGMGLLSPNRPEAWMSQVGITVAGGRYTALHPMGSLSDHQYACNEAELRFLCVDPKYAERAGELLEQCPSVEAIFTFGKAEVGEDLGALSKQASPGPLTAGPLEPGDTGWLLYTGGTTGVPKAAELSESAVAQTMLAVSQGWDLPGRRRYLACAPITHAAGVPILPTLMQGGTVVLHPSFDPDRWLRDVEREDATFSLLVPTMIYVLLDHPGLGAADLSSLETVMYGASPMSPHRLAEGIERLGRIFSQLYAQTESAGTGTSLWREHHDPKDLARLASCGKPMPNVRVGILDDDHQEVPVGESGEICLQGPTVMKGYFKQPVLTEEALAGGWLHTGDMGVRDEEGFITIVDRKKDMIVSGGFNVFPREIEDVLSAHPSVSSVAVIGVPDEKWGEAVKAIVVARPGEQVDPEALMGLVKERKGPIYAPKSVDVVDALPLTAVGKPDKKVLRNQYWGERSRGVN